MKKITWNSPVILSFALISLIALGLNTATNGATNQLLFSVYGGSLLNLSTLIYTCTRTCQLNALYE